MIFLTKKFLLLKRLYFIGENMRFFLSLFVLSIIACNNDSSSSVNEEKNQDIITEIYDDLPICTTIRENVTAYIKSEKSAYICTSGSWQPINESFSSSSFSPDIDSNNSKQNDSNGESSSSNEGACQNVIFDETNQICDNRDGQVYNIVTIGTGPSAQIWMSENLNYNVGDSWCYEDNPENCTKYGRLYTWGAAIDSSALINGAEGINCGYLRTCSLPEIIQGACPHGWHIPTKKEWEILFANVGGVTEAGTALKSQEDWSIKKEGMNTYNFCAAPSGGKDNDGDFFGFGDNVSFWSSTEYDFYSVYSMKLYNNNTYAFLDTYLSTKNMAFPIRCLLD